MKKKAGSEFPVDIDKKLKDIGERVKSRRKAIERNYETFAKANHINKVTLLRLESGENFKMSSLIQVLNALGTSIEDLLK